VAIPTCEQAMPTCWCSSVLHESEREIGPLKYRCCAQLRRNPDWNALATEFFPHREGWDISKYSTHWHHSH